MCRRPHTIDYIFACDSGSSSNLRLEKRSAKCRVIPDAATLISVAETQSSRKVSHQEEDLYAICLIFSVGNNLAFYMFRRVKLAAMCRLRWQELYRAGLVNQPGKENGVLRRADRGCGRHRILVWLPASAGPKRSWHRRFHCRRCCCIHSGFRCHHSWRCPHG